MYAHRKAKGVPEKRVLLRHILPIASNPIITTISGWFASLLAGAVFVEIIFGWNGMGKLLVEALNTRDLPVTMGCVLVIAAVFVIITTLVDIAYAIFGSKSKGRIILETHIKTRIRMRRRIVAGNWKMNTNYAEAMDLVEALKNALTQEVVGDTGVIITPPALYLSDVVGALVDNEFIAVAAQNVHEEDNGAFTGEISAPMLSSLDVDAIIIGHSERRQYFGETNEG